MKFHVICIGKLKEAYLREGVAEFVKRMRPYGGVIITELNESKIGDKPSDADRKQVVVEEGQRLLKAVPKSAYTVLLDVYGKTLSSEDLASMVSKLEVDGISDMAFIIGLSLIHISEPTRPERISYAVFCLKKKTSLKTRW